MPKEITLYRSDALTTLWSGGSMNELGTYTTWRLLSITRDSVEGNTAASLQYQYHGRAGNLEDLKLCQ